MVFVRKPTMKLSSLVLLAAFTVAASAWAQNDQYERRAIAYAKRIPVSRLDAGLTGQHLGKWLRATVGAQAKIKWEVNDCGEQTGTASDIGRDFPSCVEANAELPDGREIVIRVAVGTFAKGISGSPVLYDAFVQIRDTIQDVKQLSELPTALGSNIR
jgi:hypothetical protein